MRNIGFCGLLAASAAPTRISFRVHYLITFLSFSFCSALIKAEVSVIGLLRPAFMILIVEGIINVYQIHETMLGIDHSFFNRLQICDLGAHQINKVEVNFTDAY